jgi:hypothetical protein
LNVKAIDLITDAMQELNLTSAVEVPSAEDAAYCLKKLNSIIDEWSARQVYAFNVGFALYTLMPNHQPHTIGPTGDFVVTQRPVRVEACALVLPGVTAVDVPMNIRDDDWWAAQRVKSIATSVPTDLYYSPDEPNGSLYFWPIPTAGYQIRLETWVLLPVFADLNTTSYDLAPGYKRALTLTLAESIAPAFGPSAMQIAAGIERQAIAARKAIQSNNMASPRMATRDSGMPNKVRRGGFNYYTGGF